MAVTASRPGGRSARVRGQVLAAVLELLARDGLRGLRYEEVAELAGVHKTSVYRRWPTRDALVAEALSDFAERNAPLPDTGDLRADLVEYLCALGAVAGSPQGRALNALRWAGISEEGELRELLRGVWAGRLESLQRRLDRAVADGQLPWADAELLDGPLSGAVHQRARLGGEFTRARAELLVDVVLAGIRAVPRS
ncbi:TetR family transcriptional regulator [Actinosynnema pretiosum]|uniref:TetR family transcriptional regulator n=1 Tax=Actinosynnema pretiosum TaxID=42197 RepID=A0A290Z8I8_9PSEU|nr:TetR family transcriptional regulator [Actinosynnema pretiosum]